MIQLMIMADVHFSQSYGTTNMSFLHPPLGGAYTGHFLVVSRGI
jgi:hypothetical protein